MLPSLMKFKIYFILLSLCLSSQIYSQEFKANRELKREIESYLEGRILEFPPSRAFDMFYELSAGEVTVSISKEEWLPSPEPLTAFKLKGIRIGESSELIPFSITFPDSKSKKSTPTVRRRYSSSSHLEDEYFEIEMDHEIHGEFSIIISPLSNVTSKTELFECLETYFKISKGRQWVQTAKDRRIHFQHCGHVFGAFKQIEKIGFEDELCGLCFMSFPKPSNFRLDHLLSERLKSELKTQSDFITQGEEFELIQEAFRKVQQNFPSQLLGFGYKCYVLDSSQIFSFSSGAGQVFVSNGTLKQFIDPDYLELVLAMELAHSELRHVVLEVLRVQRNAESVEAAQQLLGMMAMASQQFSPSEGHQYFSASLQAMSTMIDYANYSGMASAQELFSQKREIEADILMYAYVKKNGIPISKATELLKMLRSMESVKLRGFDGSDNFGSHLPLRRRIAQSENHEINFHDQTIRLEKSGLEVGTTQLLLSGYVDHKESTNERYMNFMLFQVETNEFAPSETSIGEIIVGSSLFKCLQQDMKLSYFDTQNYLFVNFSNNPLSEEPVIRKFSSFEISEEIQ